MPCWDHKKSKNSSYDNLVAAFFVIRPSRTYSNVCKSPNQMQSSLLELLKCEGRKVKLNTATNIWSDGQKSDIMPKGDKKGSSAKVCFRYIFLNSNP